MNQAKVKNLQSIKLKRLFRILFINIILFSCQNLFGQESLKNNDGDNPKPRIIKSYSDFKSDESSMIIDNLRFEVNSNPESKGVIIVYCGRVCQYGEIEAHLRGITSALKFKKVELEKYTVIFGGFKEKTTTEFWIVPQNACFPVPTSSIDLKDVIFKGKFKKNSVDYECCF